EASRLCFPGGSWPRRTGSVSWGKSHANWRSRDREGAGASISSCLRSLTVAAPFGVPAAGCPVSLSGKGDCQPSVTVCSGTLEVVDVGLGLGPPPTDRQRFLVRYQCPGGLARSGRQLAGAVDGPSQWAPDQGDVRIGRGFAKTDSGSDRRGS